MFALVFALPALADEAGAPEMEDCETSASVRAVVPAANSVGVPLDIAPTVIFGESCGGSDSFTADLVDADGGVVLHQVLDTSDILRVDLPMYSLVPEAALLADHDYVLRLSSPAGDLTEVPFHTGSAVYVGLGAEPEITAVGATFEQGVLSISAEIVAAIPEDGLASTFFVAPTGGVGDFLGVGGEFIETGFAAVDPMPDEACASVVQIDAVGAAHTAESCVEVVEIPTGDTPTGGSMFGCNREMSSSLVFLPALGLASLIRRRKS